MIAYRMKIMSLSTALLIGASVACVTHTPVRPEQKDESYVTTVAPRVVPTAVPTDVDTIVWMMTRNPNLSESNAFQIYDHVKATIKKYKQDPAYQQSTVSEITPKMVIAIIARESSFDPETLGSLGEVGLMQIYPKYHIKDLKSSGIITQKKDLWKIETNISAGIHVLMGYARTARTAEHALAIYNAGASRWEAGRSYARTVLQLTKQIDG